MAVEISSASDLTIGKPRALFKAPLPDFGVSADGQRFLFAEPVLRNAFEIPELSVLINWDAQIGQAGIKK